MVRRPRPGTLLLKKRGGPSIDADAQALFDAMEVDASEDDQTLYINYITALKAEAGLWESLDADWLKAAHDDQAANLNIKAPGTFTLVPINDPVFTEDRGYTGLAASARRLNTGFNPTTAPSPKFTQNAGSFSVWDLTDRAANSGVEIGNGNNFIATRFTGDVAIFRVNHSTGSSVAVTGSNGYYLANRSAAAATQHYKNGVQVVTGTDTAATPDNVNFQFLARTPGASFSSDQVSAGHIGGPLTTQQVTALYNAKLAFLQAKGAVA